MRRLHEMSYVELEKHAIDVISELKIKAYGAGYEQGELDTKMEAKRTKPAQEQRDRIVERAKADINTLLDDFSTINYTGLAYRVKPEQQFSKYAYAGIDAACDAEYIVNKEKRTVVALMKGVYTGNLYAKGIAKCAPDDCFNVHIGKAIALRRALGLDVPDEYINAPQPTEVRVWDVVRFPTGHVPNNLYEVLSLTDNWNLRLVKNMHSDNGVGITAHVDDFTNTKIIDDSREGGRRID